MSDFKKYKELTVACPMEAISLLLELRSHHFVSYRGQRDSSWGLGPHGIPEFALIDSDPMGVIDCLLNKEEARRDIFDEFVSHFKAIGLEYEWPSLNQDAIPERTVLDEILSYLLIKKGGFHGDELREAINAYWQSLFVRRGINRRLDQFFKYSERNHDLKVGSTWWHKIVFAQHYGLKTLLLDWTSNPLVALYFACESILSNVSDDQKDEHGRLITGSVFALKVNDTSSENQNLKSRWTSFKNAQNSYPDGERCPFWLMINPPYNNDRILRQSGKFSYHPSIFDRNLIKRNRSKIHPGETLIRINIADLSKLGRNLTKEIRIALGVMNIHHGSLFPDYVGYSHFVNSEWGALTTVDPCAAPYSIGYGGDSMNELRVFLQGFKSVNGNPEFLDGDSSES